MGAPDKIVRTVKVVVADNAGNILATSDRANKEEFGDVGVVSFKYTFDDEDPDECIIKLQASSTTGFDRMKLERSTLLQVSWGYLDGDMTYASSVVIRDLNTKYGRNIITTELVCADLLYFITTTRSTDAEELSMVDHLKNQFFGKYRVVIRDSGKRIWSLDMKKSTEERPGTGTFFVGASDPFFLPDSTGERYGNFTGLDVEHNVTDNTVTASIGPDYWYCKADHPMRVWLQKPRGILQTNRSKSTVLRDFLKEAPHGPWYVTGRGNTLLIHNRDFENQPIRSYEYHGEPGNLIDFTAKTKYDQFEKNSVSSELYDPDNAKFYSLETYIDELFSMATFEEKFNDKTINQVEFAEWLQDWVKLMKAYEQWNTSRVGITIYGEDVSLTKEVYISDSGSKPEVHNRDYWKVKPNPPETLIDNTSVDWAQPYIGPAVLRGFIYSRPLQFLEDRANFIGNEMRKMEMEKEEAKFIVIGDIGLQSEMRVQVSNVFSQHSGLYYIKKCEHTITPNGYKTEMDCLKILAKNRIRTGETKEKVTVLDGEPSVDIEEQYIREQELYGNPIKIAVTGNDYALPVTPTYAQAVSGGPFLVKPAITEITSVKEELSEEDFINKIVNIKFKRGGKLLPNVEGN